MIRENIQMGSAARVSKVVLASSFAIWVAYGTLVGMRRLPAAVLVGLAGTIGLLFFAVACHIKIQLLDWVMLGYFVTAAIVTFGLRSTTFANYGSVLIWSFYAAATWASILLGSPFTLQYARLSAPPERWSSPAFLRANQIISMVWGAAFVINIVLVVIALNTRYNVLLTGTMAPLLMTGAAALFTSYYGKSSRERAQRDAL